MAAQLGTHPSADALRVFAVGKLNDMTAEVIMSHLVAARVRWRPRRSWTPHCPVVFLADLSFAECSQ